MNLQQYAAHWNYQEATEQFALNMPPSDNRNKILKMLEVSKEHLMKATNILEETGQENVQLTERINFIQHEISYLVSSCFNVRGK